MNLGWKGLKLNTLLITQFSHWEKKLCWVSTILGIVLGARAVWRKRTEWASSSRWAKPMLHSAFPTTHQCFSKFLQWWNPLIQTVSYVWVILEKGNTEHPMSPNSQCSSWYSVEYDLNTIDLAWRWQTYFTERFCWTWSSY